MPFAIIPYPGQIVRVTAKDNGYTSTSMIVGTHFTPAKPADPPEPATPDMYTIVLSLPFGMNIDVTEYGVLDWPISEDDYFKFELVMT